MKFSAVQWRYSVKAVLLAMFFLTAAQIGFNIGYASGAVHAHDKALKESRLFYQNFIGKLKSGKAFKLWSLKMVPVNKRQVNICQDNKKWIGAGSAEDYNLRYAADRQTGS